MSTPVNRELIQVAGAGPAGLAAAIPLARAGRRVVVHEAAAEVGSRYQSDASLVARTIETSFPKFTE